MTLWTSFEVENATGGWSTRRWEASGVSIDTRTISPGDLFVALKDKRDGHEYVSAAFDAGAAAAVVERTPDSDAQVGNPLLVVPDTLEALKALAKAARSRSGSTVVAITGSVGKTSCKDMLYQILRHRGPTHAAEASYNNHWGVPLTLARLPADTEFAIIEIGMNQPGEIGPLSALARECRMRNRHRGRAP